MGAGGIGMADEKDGAVAQAFGQRIDRRFSPWIALGGRQQSEQIGFERRAGGQAMANPAAAGEC